MRTALCLGALVITASAAGAADVPAGYQLVYTSDFAQARSVDAFCFSDPAAWRLGQAGKSHYLELFRKSDYKTEVRSPFNLGILGTHKFGDFVLEADLMQTGKEYGHRDMCLFFGLQDRSRFYYAHISSKSDDHAHQVFIVNCKPRTKISAKTSAGVDWGRDVWRKVRLERKTTDGSIRVFFDDMGQPIMTARDTTFGEGLLGFGSFDDTGRVANVRIWAPRPTPLTETPDLFSHK